MRFKSPITLFNARGTFYDRFRYSTASDNYTSMVNQAMFLKNEMQLLIRRQGKNKCPIEAMETKLEILNTYHSLNLTDQYSLTLEDTTDLLNDNKTHHGRDFYDQLRAINHHRILNYCRLYQQQLFELGWGKCFIPENAPDEYILSGIDDLAKSFVLRFREGLPGSFKSMNGKHLPNGTFYFHDRPEQEYISAAQILLVQTLKQPPDDPFMNAAIIHNEFAKGHQFDKEFGLLFCRLHMNFALMLTGHAPTIIDSSKKEEYLELAQLDIPSNPQAFATFLVKCSIQTYQKFILPTLVDGLKNYFGRKL